MRPGNSRSRFQRSLLNSILMLMKPIKMMNAILNTAAGANEAMTEPIATPAIAGSAHRRTTCGITAPFFLCSIYERIVVGIMMASEVPMQSCMRTSSGTSIARNTSYSTGTIMAPPPIPNRPARMPTRMPAPAIQSASRTISPIGYPRIMLPRMKRRLGGDVRQIVTGVQHQRQRISHDGSRGRRLDRLGRKMAAEGARARHRAEQAEHMTSNRMQPHALGQFALDIRHQRQRRFFRRGKRRRLAVEQRINAEKP